MSKSEAVARGASLTCAIFTGLQALALWMPAHRAVENGGWGCLPGGSCPDRVEVHAAISHTSGELALALWGCFVAILVIHMRAVTAGRRSAPHGSRSVRCSPSTCC